MAECFARRRVAVLASSCMLLTTVEKFSNSRRPKGRADAAKHDMLVVNSMHDDASTATWRLAKHSVTISSSSPCYLRGQFNADKPQPH